MNHSYKMVKDVVSLPARQRTAHKGNYGHVLVVGGSVGMIGAPSLAANAALRVGAGLVTMAVPQLAQMHVAVLAPCATSAPLACNERAEPTPHAISQMLHELEGCDVLAMGPGMGVGMGQQALVRSALEQTKPVVIDADGLNNLRAIDNWWDLRRCALVLTPHPGEFSRLTGQSVLDIQNARLDSTFNAHANWKGSTDLPLVCVLKGEGTIVTDGQRVFINNTGNPGMATGGTGDVLTGMIAGLCSQGLSPFDAACLGVRCHGRAGDLGAEELGEISLIASDLLDFLPDAMREARIG